MSARRCTYDDATHGACMATATRRLTVRCHGRARGVISEMCAEHCEHVLTHGVEASVENIAAEPDPDTEAGRVIDARAPWVRRLTAVVVGASAATACDNYEADRKREWEAPCRDESTLIATTAGSPDRAVCPNRQHKMRVAVTSGSTPNNAAAVIFCECTPKQEAK